ncbi:MAG: hypothetical protein NVS2B3_05310 [Vulcanimicrobiaceae bacterium]
MQLLPFVTKDELDALYSGAEAFIYPSLYEGFGLPVLEAMAHHTAVIGSSTTSIPEVAGDAAHLVDPSDERQIAEAIVKVCRDRSYRESLVGRGALRAQAFTWRRTAQATVDAYVKALAST